jgi:hypothetical protein
MLDANGVDILFAGARCAGNEDCASQLCDQGRCRCTTTADCCAAGNDAACLEQGTKCAPPPAGTPGSGNTCRAGHPHGASGIRVLASAGDRWVRARPVWNQPTYSVTNVNEDGTVPRSSAWTASWSDPATNGYRANVSGRQNPLVTGDLTAGPSRQVSCSAAGAAVSAPVCNRGAETIGAGIAVGFYAAGVRVCGAQTAQALAPGACVQVGCTWSAPPTQASLAVDLDVVPNDAGAYRECQAGNNHGTVLGVFCAP